MMLSVKNNGINDLEDTRMKESYRDFLTKFNGEDTEVNRQLFIHNGAENWRKICARNEIELFICGIIGEMIDGLQETDGVAITDKENDKFYCFLKDNNFTWREEENEDGELLLHIKDNDSKITIILSNKSDLKDISHLGGADVFMLDNRFMVGFL